MLQPLDAPCSWNSGHGALLSWLGPLTLVSRVRFAASWCNLCFNHLIEEWLCQMQNSEKIVQDSWESQHLNVSVAHLSFQSSLKMFPCPLGFSLPWNKICKCMFKIQLGLNSNWRRIWGSTSYFHSWYNEKLKSFWSEDGKLAICAFQFCFAPFQIHISNKWIFCMSNLAFASKDNDQ